MKHSWLMGASFALVLGMAAPTLAAGLVQPQEQFPLPSPSGRTWYYSLLYDQANNATVYYFPEQEYSGTWDVRYHVFSTDGSSVWEAYVTTDGQQIWEPWKQFDCKLRLSELKGRRDYFYQLFVQHERSAPPDSAASRAYYSAYKWSNDLLNTCGMIAGSQGPTPER
jgi:hypothetical protein